MGRRRKKNDRHSAQAVRNHLGVGHPLCPAEVADQIVARIEGRVWDPKASIGQAVGIAIDAYVRHQLTDYEELMTRHRLTRDEARQVVQPEITAILLSWRKSGEEE